MQAHKIYSWNYQQNKNRDSFFARLFLSIKKCPRKKKTIVKRTEKEAVN